jgi:iron complex transport system permease protein
VRRTARIPVGRQLTLRLARPGVSFRAPRRATGLCLVLLVLVLIAICVFTAYAETPLSLTTVVRGILGQGSSIDLLIVRGLQLPRVLEGALVGAALGLSGALFQSLTRNPLATPDLMGINEGAAVVAVWMIIGGAPLDLVPFGALAGALGATALVGILAVRRRMSVQRLILVGIGINAFAAALVAYILTHATYGDSTVEYAQQWLLGSLFYSSWHDIRIVAIALVVLTPFAFVLGRQLNVLQLGDDAAASLGIRTNRLQLGLALIGALLAAAAVSVAGPIAFVAFLAPHIARRLSRTASAASLPAAMLVGALLVLVADFVARRVVQPTELPVGIFTVVIGAPYLLYLLYRYDRDAGVA